MCGHVVLCRFKSAVPKLNIFKTTHMSKEPTVLPSRALFEKDKNQQGVVVVCIEDGKTMDRVMHQSLCLCLQQLPTSSLLPYIMHSRKLSLQSFLEFIVDFSVLISVGCNSSNRFPGFVSSTFLQTSPTPFACKWKL